MASLFSTFRSGDWLRKDRVIVYPLIMAAITAASTIYVLIANGGTLPNGSPFGSDFVSYWIAARQALAGHPEVPYAAGAFAEAQNAVFGDGNFYAFYYPPHYLAYVLPFGALPYNPALAAWIGVTLLAALAVNTAIAGRRWEVVLLTVAFPAAFLTISHGQNAFLAAALFGGALVLLPRRPVLAGILFGLLTFKPQLGILIPVALLAGGQWRAIFSAAVSAAAVAGASALLFGIEVWGLFIAQGQDALETLRQGHVGWNKMISTYAMLRLAGIGDAAAMTAQAAVSLASAAIVFIAWRGRTDTSHELKCALLLSGALLATPFGLNYDLFLLAPAIAFIAAHGLRHGFEPWQKTLLAAVYVSPFAVLWLMADKVSVAPVVLLAFFAYQAHNILRTGRSRTQAPKAYPAE